tara:strand:- start:7229 stop:8116 length:888 start_codon:yes stop_codon:yes gene_type:complete
MGTGIAKSLKQQYPEAKFVFGDPETYHDPANNKLRINWSEVFENNPNIVQPEEPVKTLVCIPDYPGCRPYIDYEGSEIAENKYTKFKWMKDYSPIPGELYFSESEKSEAAEIALRLPSPFFVIEPNIADKEWTNHKGWPVDRWQKVVTELKDEVEFIQMSKGETLRGIHQVITPSFRQACAVLSCAGGFIGTDGGLHHAAAALDIPAVVLWGHYSSPQIFGYTDHINLRHANGLGCGSAWSDCDECKPSMEKITVEEVIASIKEIIKNGRYISSRKRHKEPAFRMVGGSTKGSKK